MMNALVGYTGFVGSNIDAAAGGAIAGRYNSKNIEEAYGIRPDLLIYAGLRAEKYLANRAPQQDREQIRAAQRNIERIAPGKLVLISTIDVFKDPRRVDENSAVETEGLSAYGYNRRQLEIWAREYDPDALIIRLPGLFGINLKKNFIYDYLHRIPFMLKAEKLAELSEKEPELRAYYRPLDNGFYQVCVAEEQKNRLRELFEGLNFSALNFTDSRSRYQFYHLGRLWNDMQTALHAGIRVWHPATEPVSAAELYRYLEGKEFANELPGTPAEYDYRTLYAREYGGSGGYIAGKEEILREIKEFCKGEQGKWH